MKNKKDDWIEEQNKKIFHWLLTVFFSIVTSFITTIVLAKLIGL